MRIKTENVMMTQIWARVVACFVTMYNLSPRWPWSPLSHWWALLERNWSGWWSKSKIRPVQVKFFCWYGDMPLFRGFLWDWLHLAYRIESDPERAIYSQVGSLWKEWFSSCLFFFFGVRTAFKGIIYPLAIKVHNILDLVHQNECFAFWGSKM